MALFAKYTNLLIMSTLLGLIGLPTIVTPATAQNLNNTGNPDLNPSVNQPSSTPTYPAAPPPEPKKPLPKDRELEDADTQVDYRISNLLGDFTGNLWVGSWR
ncbi:MAG: transcriptional regulator, partial [Cuspidothrix sp.]